MTVIYPDLGDESREDVEALQADATDHGVEEDVDPKGSPLRRTTFTLGQVEEFHALYHLAETAVGADNLELLLNDRQVPLARELWLPLIWSLRR